MLASAWEWIVWFKTFLFKCILPIFQEFYYRYKYGKEFADDFRRKNFAVHMEGFPENYNSIAGKYKEALFQELKDRKNLRILEIGIGNGSNFSYYPPGTKLTALEPNPHFEASLRKKMEQYPNIILERVCIASGENMHELESGGFDTVVTGIVACSVGNFDEMLKEISRVLVPGGKYFFIEHVLDHKFSILFLVQKLFALSRFWPLVYDGCSFVDLSKTISKSNYFSSTKITKFNLSVEAPDAWPIYFIGPHIYGTATKG